MPLPSIQTLFLKMIENYDETSTDQKIMGLFGVETINSNTGEVIKPRVHITLQSLCDGSLYEKGNIRCEYYDQIKKVNITVYSASLNENYEDDLYDEEDFLSDKYIVVKKLSDGTYNNYLCHRCPVCQI